MKIAIHRNESSQPKVYDNVINAYTKGKMYCVLLEQDGVLVTHKYPLSSIFRVEEDYNAVKQEAKQPSVKELDEYSTELWWPYTDHFGKLRWRHLGLKVSYVDNVVDEVKYYTDGAENHKIKASEVKNFTIFTESKTYK
jgi:hypothetical protein